MSALHARHGLRAAFRCRGRPPEALREALAKLGPGTFAIDCGANVGDVTVLLAATGADVVAFEPNPVPFVHLARRCARMKNVRCIQAAVSTCEGSAPLFLHVDSEIDPLRASTGSSLLSSKRNVDPGRWIDVVTIDLDAFVLEHAPVDVMKMDVEGAEIDILERFLQTGRLDSVRTLVVEMHDWHTAELAARGAVIRDRLADQRYAHVRLDWS